MPTTIPDTMPADWLDDGAEIRGTTPDDAELRKAMQQAYREGLDRLGVAGIMGSLKDLCIRVAGGESLPPTRSGVEPEPNPEPEEPPPHPPPLGHDGMAV